MTAFYLYDNKRKGYYTGSRENTGGRSIGWFLLTQNILLGRAWASESNADRWASNNKLKNVDVIEVTVK